jgi:hypothetical protein
LIAIGVKAAGMVNTLFTLVPFITFATELVAATILETLDDELVELEGTPPPPEVAVGPEPPPPPRRNKFLIFSGAMRYAKSITVPMPSNNCRTVATQVPYFE